MKHKIAFWVARRLPRKAGDWMLRKLGYRFSMGNMVMGVITSNE